MLDETIETGLLSLPVNQPVERSAGVAQTGESREGVNTHTQVAGSNPAPGAVVNMPVGWTIQRAAAFIRDIAHNMYDMPFILKTHGVSQAQYDGIKDQEFFQSALRAMTIEWNSIGNTQKRLAIEAAIALEDALPTMAARLHKPTELLTGVVELAKLLAKMAGVGETTQNNAPTERFKITINLGADTQQFEKTKTIEINSVGGAESRDPAVQPQP